MAIQELMLCLKLSDFEALHKIAAKQRKKVQVSGAALCTLLQDHSAALAHIRDLGSDYRDPGTGN